MKYATSPPWHLDDLGRQGTPREWVDWFLANNDDGRLEIAEWSIRFADESTRCIERHGRRSISIPAARPTEDRADERGL